MVTNKYFSARLELLVGAPVHESAEDALAGLSRAVVAAVSSDADKGSDASAYGGVLLVHLAQDPAVVPWHLLPRGGGSARGACCFHVVMVFCGDAADVDADVGGTAAAAPSLKDRWQYFAVENGYECVFHGPLHPYTSSGVPPPAGGDASLALEVVDPACGRRGLLQAPLAGSSRLYQLLCNTLWPIRARHDCTEPGSATSLAPATLDATAPANGFVVVGNDAAVMWDVLRGLQCATPSPAHASPAPQRRRLRFFTSVVTPPVSEATTSPASPIFAAPTTDAAGGGGAAAARVVLVNRYYAAVVQPRLVQTAFFDSRMQELLDRYWEQHLVQRDSAAEEPVCEDAPAVVLWPPTPPLPPSRRRGGRSPGPEAGVAVDGRAAYPPLEAILDSLRCRGCHDTLVVVVTPASPVSARTSSTCRAPVSLTEYEAQVCAARGVEVMEVCTECSDAAASRSAAAAEAVEEGQQALSVPVLCDEDDTAAPRGVDRLNELLHCVQWSRTASMPLPTTAPRDQPESTHRERNALLLLAYGQSAVEEETWMRAVLTALPTDLQPERQDDCSGTAPEHQTPTTWTDFTYVWHAAPSVAAAMADDAAAAEPHGAGTHPASAKGVELHVVTSYFDARVAVHVAGGWWAWWSSHCAAPVPAPAPLSIHWANAYDAFVLVTSLAALRQEAGATSPGNGASAGESEPSTRASLAEALRTLARKQSEDWLGGASTDLESGASPGNPAEAVDSPLLLLLLTDVTAADAGRAAEAEEAIHRLTRPQPADVAAQAHDVAGEEAEWWVPMELVFAAPRGTAAAPARSPSDDFGAEGTARVREAVKQHLWPHRTPAFPTAMTSRRQPGARAASPPPTPAPTAPTAAAPTVQEADVRKACPAGEAAAAPDTTPVLVPAAPRADADEARWAAPAIGCALPPGFLVDPETLRSVAVAAVRGVTLDPVDDADDVGATGTAPKPREQELLAWTGRMKRYGHRLGEARRQEQAALLALALERVL